MDSAVSISEEYACDTRRNCDSSIPKVEFRERDTIKDFSQLCSLYWEYHLRLTGEDLSEELTFPDGTVIFKVEKHIMDHLARGRRIQVAHIGEKIVGFVIYYFEFEPFIFIRSTYVLPEYRKSKVLRSMLLSIKPTPRKLMFQTNKVNPPNELLEYTEKDRVLLHEDAIYNTWLLDLRS